MTTSTIDIAAILTNLHEAFARHDLDTISRYFADDTRFINPDGELNGKAARLADEERIYTMFDEPTIEVTQTLIDGNRAVELSNLHGKAKIGSNAGSDITFRYVVYYEFDGELITFQEIVFDRATLAARLGLG